MNDKVELLLKNAVSVSAKLPENADEIIKTVIQTADIMARCTHLCLIVLDVISHKYVYVSDNPLLLSGVSPDEAMKKGFAFYVDNVPEDEVPLMQTVSALGWKFYNSLPPEERPEYTLSYSYHFYVNETPCLVTQYMTPMVMSENGETWLALSAFGISSHKEPGHVTMRKKGTPELWNYDFEKNVWVNKPSLSLTDIERSIIIMSAQGFTMDEIANRINRSVDTVKFHKRKLFAKLQVKTIAEALTVANVSKLI